MPRANRYIVSGHVYHVTHRCHNRRFLFRFARDRDEYRERLRQAVKLYDLSVLGYTITANHTHLLIRSERAEELSRLMQKLEGEFAEYYNIRKHRSGAFWGGRYHATMVDSGEYFWNCLRSSRRLGLTREVLQVEEPRQGVWTVREAGPSYG